MLQPYEARLIVEHVQLVDRIEKLEAMLAVWDDLIFEPHCTREQLGIQLSQMKAYCFAIEGRNDFGELIKKGFADVRK